MEMVVLSVVEETASDVPIEADHRYFLSQMVMMFVLQHLVFVSLL